MSHPRFLEGEVRIIGHRWSPRVHELKAFLSRSRVAYRWLDVERDREALEAVGTAAPGTQRFPIVIFPDGTVLVEPDVRAVAEKLGLDTHPDSRTYDLIIVGAGPAGLTAAINAGSEGLRTVVAEQEVPGGQASYSASIENYPGFPEGLSGSDLARRTLQQAERFGVEIIVTRRATGLRTDEGRHLVSLDDGSELVADTVLLAIGVSFRWLDAPGCPALVGAGIYYGAATAEAAACAGQDIHVLGGGNSAGQAALLLARYARHVTILTLEDSLEETMSAYLVERIRRTENISVLTGHTVVAAGGEGHLEWIEIQNVATRETVVVPADGLFVFIGATPRTDWLPPSVVRDAQGFILAGIDLCRDGTLHAAWPLSREPYELETTTPGVFVAGDVRSGSVKRIASAVGEGAMAVHLIHRYRGRARNGAGRPAANRQEQPLPRR
ncbi:MAG TPA: FAD-dependent oxidoreductase [Gemmatimonadaceae bacterium]|nr:FAD-dependent oxidoreductase [Gemmatimonadaceae bacterium]